MEMLYQKRSILISHADSKKKEKSELEQKNEEISTMKDEIEKVKQRLDVSDKYKKRDYVEALPSRI